MENEEKDGSAGVDRDFLTAELFEAVSHPTRIQILRILSREPLGFAELKRKLGISSSGNLSHHLNKLVTLVETNAQGKYKITDQGHEALFAIRATQVTEERWTTTTHAFIGALIFYALFLTAAIVSKMADVFTPVSALISTIVFCLIFRSMLLRRVQRSQTKVSQNESV